MELWGPTHGSADRSVLPHLPPGGLLGLTLSPGLVVTRLETCQSDDDTSLHVYVLVSSLGRLGISDVY